LVLDTIPTTKEELYSEFRLLADKLSLLGLSPYEARAYIALVAHGYGNAEVIATTAQIPRTSSYKILQSLEDKGFAIGTQGRPKIFKPEPPGNVYEKFSRDLEETFKKLTLLHEIVHDRGMPQLIFTIAFQNAVVRGVKLTVVTSPTQGVFEYAEVVHRNGLLATDVIADNKQALIAAPDLSACGYTDNELLAKHLQDFLEIMLKH